MEAMAGAGGGIGAAAEAKTPSYKRMNMDAGRVRERNDERKKHHRDDYFNSGGASGDRRNSPSTPNNRAMHGANARLPPGVGGANVNSGAYTPGSDNRSGPPYAEGGDRWGHARDRYGGGDYKRDRYDNYGGRGSCGCHRDHRDRDRDRRPDKRRYHPPHAPPPLTYAGHYMPPNYYMGNGGLPPGAVPHGVYRGDPRYVPSGEWPRDSRMDYPPDYRRGDYDRRPPT